MDASDIIFYLHIASLVFVALHVFLADHMGFGWMSGKTPTLLESKVKKYHYRTLAGLILMIITGTLLFWPAKDYLLTRPQFWVKMTFIGGLIINSFVIESLSKNALTRTFASLSFKERLPILFSGGVSTLCWLGAFAGAFFLF